MQADEDPAIEALYRWIELITHELALLQMTQNMLTYHNTFQQRHGWMPLYSVFYEYSARHDSDKPLGIIYGGMAPANTLTKYARLPYEVPCEVLDSEIRALLAERRTLVQAIQDASDYAPGGRKHRRLVRHYASVHGMHRYSLREAQVKGRLSSEHRRS